MFYTDNWFSVAQLQWARLWLLLGGLLITLIFYLSLSAIQLPIPRIPNIDKVMHFTAYCCLMGWFVQIFHHRYGRLLIGLGFIVMGIAIEFLQALHPLRHFDVLDMLANMSGVIIAWAAGLTWLDSILVCTESMFKRFMRLF
jgi:VanZ family protein